MPRPGSHFLPIEDRGVRDSGRVQCWGDDRYYETSAINQNDSMNFVQVADGGSHVCGLRADGSVTCWGWDNYGQLGDYVGSDEVDANF